MFSLIPSYFPPISHWKYIIDKDCNWNIYSSFQKQTLTNRTYIHGANGILMLSVPIKHTNKKRKKRLSEIEIENNHDWTKNHFKSIKIAYQSSPYYEFYESKLIDHFSSDFKQLFKLNLSSIKFVFDCLKLEYKPKKTEFRKINFKDLSVLTNIKRSTNINTKYTQLFEEKNGFLYDLSILDLLFNCGPNTLDYI